MNSMDLSIKMQFITSFPTDSVLEFSDLVLWFDVTTKQTLVDIFSKSINSFIYVILPHVFPQEI